MTESEELSEEEYLQQVRDMFAKEKKKKKPMKKPAWDYEVDWKGKTTNLPSLPLPAPSRPDVITLCLDLDQTLIFSECDPTTSSIAKVYKRPGVDEFLEKMAKHFELVIFTSATQRYADAVIDGLDPEGKLIKHRLYQESCIRHRNNELRKDVSRLGRDMKKVLLVDDQRRFLRANPRNGILIEPFEGPGHDSMELKSLGQYLQSIADVDDVTMLVHPNFVDDE